MAKFTHLHVHSHYSLLDGLAKPEELLDYAKELGMDSLALTDHGVMYGAVEFFQKAKERGIKPIIGCEVYQALESRRQKRPKIDDTRYHLLLLAKNQKGYENLVKLVTKAHLEGFYYKPRIDEELLEQYSEGLVACSACIQGKVPRLFLAQKKEEAKEAALKYKKIFGDDFYLEIQHHPKNEDQIKANKGLVSLSKELKIPLVATNDVHYLKTEDGQAQDILMMINTGADPNDPERLSMKTEDLSLTPPEEMEKFFKDVPEAIENTQEIVQKCNFEFQLGKTKLPSFDLPEKKKNDDYLKELCYKGLEETFGKNPKKEVVDRLEYELSVIRQTGFASYFLIVQDFVNWAKEKHIVVGPGRGSVGGSLAAYLLNITNINPLKYDLLFERFLNPERISMPDIDLDFADRRRDEVISHVSEKYGKERVAQIITFGTMAARAVIRDVGRVLKYSYGYCDKVAKMIPFGFSLKDTLEKVKEFKDFYESDEQARKLIDLAQKLEGVARHASTHACGVVISADPLTTLVPLQHPTQNDETIVTQYEMHAIEDLGLLKMDFLGLKNLTIIEDTLARIYVIRNKEKLDIENIPLDDEETFQLLQQGNTTGVFQLECLSGDTIVSNTTIQKLYRKKGRKRLESVYLDEGKIHKNEIGNIAKGREKDLYTLIAENGWYIKASKDHSFLTENGWKQLKNIKKGERILMKTKAKHLLYNTCQGCGKQISGQKEGKSKFCHSCSARFHKNPSKKSSRKKIRESRLNFYRNGGKPWNFGATVENNELWRRTSQKISKARRGRNYEKRHGEKEAKRIKEILSRRSREANNPMFGKPAPHRKGGFRKDLGHYVRSSWEADFARILNLHDLEYKYEPKTFKLIKPNGEVVHYTPDFYVKSKNTFYEIKGWLHEIDKEKISLFQNQYPQYNFVLVNTTKFAEFSLRYKKLVNWECPRVPLERSFRFIRVEKIKYSGREETYDIAMRSPGNNFVANGFLVHNSGGMKRFLKQLKPVRFEDIVAMVALYRPGPMQFLPDFIERRHGRQRIEYLHPNLKPILEETNGICIYQEQLMRIAREIAGFSLSEADILRKAVGKKIEKLLHSQKKKFIQGTVNNGIKKEVGEKIWQWILPFARYGFNKSHSAAYAMIAYQTAFLKAHYPVEFMASLMTSEKNDVEKIAILIEDARQMGIETLPPNVNESLKNFTVVPDKKEIRFGLLAIKNVGENVVDAIVEEKKKDGPFKSIKDFAERISTEVLNKKSLESLIRAGVFDDFEERGRLLKNMDRILDVVREKSNSKKNDQKGLFEGAKFDNHLNLAAADPTSNFKKLNWEKELLGLYISSHPLEDYRETFKKQALSLAKIDSSLANRRVRVGGIISGIKKILTKNGKSMLFMQLEDLTGKREVVVFPAVMEKAPEVFEENKVVFVSGRVDNRNGETKLVAERIEEIVNEG